MQRALEVTHPMIPEDEISDRDHLWILALRDSTIRQMLRALRSGRRRDHPLLSARFLTARVAAGDHSDTTRVRWWLLDQYASGLIVAKVATLRGPAQSLDRRVLRLLPPEAQVATVLDTVCLEGDAHLQAWSALFARYFLAIPDSFDIAAIVGIHRRTFQRWLKVGYDLLRTAMGETELAEIARATGRFEQLAGSSATALSSRAPSGRSLAQWHAGRRSGGTRTAVGAEGNDLHDALAGLWLQRIEDWTAAPYHLDTVFVPPRLRWTHDGTPRAPRSAAASSTYSSLGELLEAVGHGVIVVLGPPGSGKTTLLRRHEVDVANAGLAGHTDRVTLLAPLLDFPAVKVDGRPADPLRWLDQLWHDRSDNLPDLAAMLAAGRVDLLLDGLSELPHATIADFRDRTVAWRQLAGDIVARSAGNRVVFTCRRHDYTAPLSTPHLAVPRVDVEPMCERQLDDMVAHVAPNARELQAIVKGEDFCNCRVSPGLVCFLAREIEGDMHGQLDPAALVTAFVRCRLRDELQRNTPAIVAEGLLSDHDCARIANQAWPGATYDLPDDGALVAVLTTLALSTLDGNVGDSRGRLAWSAARRLLDAPGGDTVLAAGIALGVLEEDLERAEIGFVSPLLRAYFAGRGLLRAFHAGELPAALRHDEQYRANARDTVNGAPMRQRRQDGRVTGAESVVLAMSEAVPSQSAPRLRCAVLMSALMAPDPAAFLSAVARDDIRTAVYCATHPMLRRRLEPGFDQRLGDARAVETVDETVHNAFFGRGFKP